MAKKKLRTYTLKYLKEKRRDVVVDTINTIAQYYLPAGVEGVKNYIDQSVQFLD